MELEGVARRHDDEPTRAGASHPSGALPDPAHRVGQAQVEAHLQIGNVDAQLHGAGAGQSPDVPGTQRLPDALPAHQPRPVGHGVPALHDDGVLGDAPCRLDAGGGPLRQLPVIHEGDVRPVGVLADHLPHRRLQVPPALVVRLPADDVLRGEFGPGAAVVAVVHHLEGQTGQRFEVLGGIVDGGAGRDDPQRLELRHQLLALLLQAVQQVEAVGAQGAVVGVGLVQDEEGQVRDEAAHVVLGVLHLSQVVAQGPPVVQRLRVCHQPLLDDVGGHQGQPGALQDLPALGEVAHVAVDAGDCAGVQSGGRGHALPACHLVPGQGLDGVDGDGRGIRVGGQVIQGGRLEYQRLAAGGAGADHQVVALSQELQPHGLVKIQMTMSRASTKRTTAAEECCTTWVMPDGHGLAGGVGGPAWTVGPALARR